MTKILSVVWYKVLPAKFGGQKGISQFNDYLSNYFPLTCICSSNNEPTGTENYRVKAILPTSKWQVVSLRAWSKIIRELKGGDFSHLIIEHCYYGLLGKYARSFHHKFLIVHSHNIEYLRFKEMEKRWWPMLFWLEKKSHQWADLSLFKTPADMDHAISKFGLDPKKCLLVPFGIPSTQMPTTKERSSAKEIIYNRHGIPEGTKILLFNGTLDYAPNADGLRKIIHQIIPELRKISTVPFTVIVCGRIINKEFKDLLSLKERDYCFAGFVEDIELYFSSADLFINPVSTGGGIKVKLIEALSYGLPVVTTEQAAAGIDLGLTGEQLMTSHGDDMTAFCKYIVESWNKPPGVSEAFLERYQWKKIVGELADRINRQ